MFPGLEAEFVNSLAILSDMENSARLLIGDRLRDWDWANVQMSSGELSKIISDAFLAARKPYLGLVISISVVIQQLERFFVGNLKAIVKNNFDRVMIKRFRRLLEIPGSEKCRPLWFLLKLVLGSTGTWKTKSRSASDEDDDDDEDDDEDVCAETGDSTGLEVYSMAKFLKSLSDIKKKSKLEKRIIAALSEYSDVDAIRQVFLPAYLAHIVGDTTHGYREKLSTGNNYMAVISRFFSNENAALVLNPVTNQMEPAFVQQLTPQANVRARGQKITTTILACIWCDYIKAHKITKIDLENCKFLSLLFIINCYGSQ